MVFNTNLKIDFKKLQDYFLIGIICILLLIPLISPKSKTTVGGELKTNSFVGIESNDKSSKPKELVNERTKLINQKLQDNGYNLGEVSPDFLESIGSSLNFNFDNVTVKQDFKGSTLNTLVEKPIEPKHTNLLIYPKYNISTPIIYSTFDDLFGKDAQGNLDLLTDPGELSDDVETSVQKKLQQGILHLAFSPLPGELGNSYIVGHSSNYSFVKSKYNEIFKPIEKTSQPGEEFIIYDHEGRELVFKVFESLEVLESDVETAYKSDLNKRVVTLQTSILETVNGRLVPTKRWLTRGELVTPN